MSEIGEFSPYASAPPDGDWSYILDDYGRVYRPGWWPFACVDDDAHRDRLEWSLERDARRGGYEYRPPQEGTGICSVRLAPDTSFRAWGNQYVLVFPDRDDVTKAYALLHLWARPQGLGGYVLPAVVDLDFASGTWRFRNDPPAELQDQADANAARLLAFFEEARRGADTGAERPTTAHDRYREAQSEEGRE